LSLEVTMQNGSWTLHKSREGFVLKGGGHFDYPDKDVVASALALLGRSRPRGILLDFSEATFGDSNATAAGVVSLFRSLTPFRTRIAVVATGRVATAIQHTRLMDGAIFRTRRIAFAFRPDWEVIVPPEKTRRCPTCGRKWPQQVKR